MRRRPSRSTRTVTLFTDTSPVRSHRLDHRLAAAFDPQAGVVDQLRARPVQRLRAFSQAGEHVEFAERGGAALERFEVFVERVEQLFVQQRSEEHTSELQSLMRISYAVFCLKKKHTQR